MTAVSFKGYDAAPLRTLHLQTLGYEGQNEVFKQLSEIGEREGFKVRAQHNDILCHSIRDARGDIPLYNKWGQDNKIIVNTGDETIVVGPTIADPKADDAYRKFGQLLGVQNKDAETFFEGGNIFVGKKENGESYALIGEETLDANCAVLFLKESKRAITPKLVMALVENRPHILIRSLVRKFNFECSKYDEKALENIGEMLNVKKENIFISPQVNFHIDMLMRPLGYPYILVNNPQMSLENLQELQKKFPKKDFSKLIKETKQASQELCNSGYSDMKTAISELKKQGFIPIEIGGVYGENGKINFMNAVVNKHSDGTLSYISNSSKPMNEIEELFRQQLNKKVKNVKSVYFVSGKDNYRESGYTSVMYNLKNHHGGIHCLVCEEPNFDVWG